ncbi:MAG: hypothetical protein ACO3G4_04610, partial [Opitutaceae bacterium]
MGPAVIGHPLPLDEDEVAPGASAGLQPARNRPSYPPPMFASLTEKLTGALRNLRGASKLTEENMG